MHRVLKQISYIKSYTSCLKRGVVLVFVVVFQAKICFNGIGKEKKSLNSSQVNSNSDLNKGVDNGKEKDSDTTTTNDDLKKLAKSESELKMFWAELKALSEPDQKKKVKELTPSQAKELLKSPIREGKLTSFRILLDYGSFTSKEVAEAIDLTISLYKQSGKTLEMLNLLLRKPVLSLNDLCLEDIYGRTLVHRSIRFWDIDTCKVLRNFSSGELLDALCKKDKAGKTSLHDLALYKKIKKFKTLFAQIDESNQARAIDELFKLDNFGNSVIDYSYLPEKSHSKTLWNSSKIQSLISSRKGSKMFKCILETLPCCLKEDQLATIVCSSQYLI